MVAVEFKNYKLLRINPLIINHTSLIREMNNKKLVKGDYMCWIRKEELKYLFKELYNLEYYVVKYERLLEFIKRKATKKDKERLVYEFRCLCWYLLPLLTYRGNRKPLK